MMGSGAGAVGETVAKLVADGEKVGLATIRLFRPFPIDALLAALPDTVRSIAVLDRCKEPGSVGEPLFQDVVTAVAESERTGVRTIGGRYGLGSKEFTPAMAKAVFDELASDAPKRRFTVGIVDDVTDLSLDYDDLVPRRATRPLGGVLRARQRRHRRRQQGVGEDHRPRARPPRPGLLRVRLEEVGFDDRVAPPLRARTDPLDVPGAGGRPGRLSPVRAARSIRRARRRPTGRHVPAQRAVSGRRAVGAPADRRSSGASTSASCGCSRSTPPASPAS